MGALAIATLPVYVCELRLDGRRCCRRSPRPTRATRLFTLARYGICLAVMLPATFCAGITLPLITRILLGAAARASAPSARSTASTRSARSSARHSPALVLMPLLGLKALLVARRRRSTWRSASGCCGSSPGDGVGETRQFAMVARRGRRCSPCSAPRVQRRFDHERADQRRLPLRRVPTRGARDVVFYKDGRTATVSVRQTPRTSGVLPRHQRQARRLARRRSGSTRTTDGDQAPLRRRREHAGAAAADHARPRAARARGRGDRPGLGHVVALPARQPVPASSSTTIEIEPEMIDGVARRSIRSTAASSTIRARTS